MVHQPDTVLQFVGWTLLACSAALFALMIVAAAFASRRQNPSKRRLRVLSVILAALAALSAVIGGVSLAAGTFA
ncbi:MULTISPECIES: hypothetical protein [unclassified Pseudoclavibacter]|uniref:hypothetical protein n=1 Tax=unclassified Pseudoclavibacter TaxID=2615177 RepID=UPI0012EFDE64|nr:MULTISPECIES: hypothetical protein [unclassified Pseudoclavibacter]MBF4457378.1 hypothetical protein [Pseudoclavibacter sp. VKM Ac-2867]VXC43681.1 conserved hypothetical protein [Pseudoclavibacter sp. 8L]